MTRETRRKISTFFRYFVLIAVGFIMVYPLIWMIGATFKDNNEIFSSIGFIPKNPTLSGYQNALKSYGGDINLFKAMINTYTIVIPKVVFTIISATLTAYGFARFDFKGRGVLFAVLMSTLFLPQVVLNVPQYILFNKFGWIGHPWYLALIVPTLFATETRFVFMLNQFLRGIPRELEEAAKIDGCNSLKTLWYVIVPMLKPSIISVALFQFMWSSNDFMGPLLYVNRPARYPASIFVKMSMDADSGFDWNRVLASSLISIVPSLIVFFLAQDSFIDGIAAGGVKG
ncbi:carbohydrate ABC transporter permease [Lacrimispora sp. 210928-DFI.3.58]|uniref:carbohydrate ABC transporter permease n=1 Tax=Lacrimispora sp. 210928-DFI.3.58 TaxID=2883214 RepID=UPI0015B5E746|nr:carbohydrate ABC transporter permease [Lacrimispora sp. 210928-DFI.3.58]MCB7318960.1 carbohydrate ABC transporter permease [Lacrimispora sp. 210928-DFI.3.58]